MEFGLVVVVLQMDTKYAWLASDTWWLTSWSLRGVELFASFGGSVDLFLELVGTNWAHWPLFTLDLGS